jgi:hypothetical protein
LAGRVVLGVKPVCNCLWHRMLTIKGDGIRIGKLGSLVGVGASEASGDKCCAMNGLCSSSMAYGLPRFGRRTSGHAARMDDLKISRHAAGCLDQASAAEYALDFALLSVVYAASKDVDAEGLWNVSHRRVILWAEQLSPQH